MCKSLVVDDMQAWFHPLLSTRKLETSNNWVIRHGWLKAKYHRLKALLPKTILG